MKNKNLGCVSTILLFISLSFSSLLNLLILTKIQTDSLMWFLFIFGFLISIALSLIASMVRDEIYKDEYKKMVKKLKFDEIFAKKED